MKAHLHTVILTGIRGKSFYLLLVLGVFISAAVMLVSNFSLREPAAVALSTGFSLVRMLTIFFSIYWVHDMVAQDIERKSLAAALSLPRPRWQWVVGMYAGVSVLSFMACCLLFAILWLTMQLIDGSSQLIPVNLGLPFIASGLALYSCLLVILAFTTMVAVVSTTPFLPLLSGLLFALMASVLGPTRQFLSQADAGLVENQDQLLESLRFAGYLIPDLDRMDIRVWSIYNAVPDWSELALTAFVMACYAVLSLVVGIVVFQRREFP
ncbi:MAG: hypothetical protein V7711_05175 [Pseudomonadales bacterium]